MRKMDLGLWSILATLLLVSPVILSPMTANAASSLTSVRTSCDDYGRCFDFGGPDDLLATMDGMGSLRERFGFTSEPSVATADDGREED